MTANAERIVETLAQQGAGMTYSALQERLSLSESTIITTVSALVRSGRVERTTDRNKGNAERTTIYLSAQEAASSQATKQAAEPESRFPVALSGEARTAAKILAALQHKTPKHLAAAGGYSYPRAEALYAEVMAAR